MAATAIDIRQSQTRVLQDQLDSVAVTAMDSVLASINNELTQPARLIAAATPSLVVTVGSGTVVNPNTSKNRVLPFINNTPVAFTGGTITFPSGTGNITTSPGTTYPITVGASQYIAVLVQLDTSGNIEVSVGAAAGSLGAVVIPTGNASLLSLGYVIIQSNGSSVVQNITNGMLYQFAVGSGGGGGAVVTFTLANNQSSPANITNFLVNSATANGFSAEYSIIRSYAGSSAPFSENSTFYTNLGTGGVTGTVDALAVQSNSQILIGGGISAVGSTTVDKITRLNANGTIDTAFNSNIIGGSVLIGGVVNTISVQSNQQIVVGGSFVYNGGSSNRLVRFNTDGTVDTAFMTNLGTNFTTGGGGVFASAIQSNQQIVVGGKFTTPENDLARLNSDGTTDTTFGTNIGFGANNNVQAIAIQSNQQILVGGIFTTFNGVSVGTIIRLNTDGTLDTTFNTNASVHIVSSVAAIAVQSNQQILVGNGSTGNIARLNADGTLDTTFNTNIGTGFNSLVNTISVEPNQQILVGGGFTAFNGTPAGAIARLNTNGTLDTTFNTSMGSGFNNAVQVIISTGSAPTEIIAGGTFTAWNGFTRNRLVEFNDAYTNPTIEYLAEGVIRGMYSPANTNWYIGAQTSFEPEGDPGVVFSMTSAGQMQYTTTNIVGTLVASTLRFTINNL